MTSRSLGVLVGALFLSFPGALCPDREKVLLGLAGHCQTASPVLLVPIPVSHLGTYLPLVKGFLHLLLSPQRMAFQTCQSCPGSMSHGRCESLCAC